MVPAAALPDDVIDIWEWSLDRSDEETARLSAILSADEAERAGQFYKPRDTTRFIAGRGILRHVLGFYLGKPPAELIFTANDFGKPAIAAADAPPLHFNLSHSAGRAALAVSARFVLGLDIEEIKPLKEDIAGRFFSARECARLAPLEGDRYFETFFRCWTRKEAFVKAHGAGLSLPLDSFDVTLAEGDAPMLQRLEGDPDASWRWSVLALRTPPGFAGAVVAMTEGSSATLRYRTLSELSFT